MGAPESSAQADGGDAAAARTLAAMAKPRSLRRAALAGSAVALLIDLVLLLAGHATLLRDPGPLGGIYDAQGRAFLDGNLSVDAAKVGFEGFLIDGKTYVYYGPFPALLRLPVLAVTHGLDGRLTQLSMLLGLAVMLGAGAAVQREVRRLMRPGAEIGRGDVLATFGLQLALGAGSIVLFLAGRPVVYNETELWGAALSVAALAAIVAVVRRPATRTILLAGLLALLAINTRVSVGLGPPLALSVLSLGVAGRLNVPRFGPAGRALAALAPRGTHPRGDKRLLALLAAAALVPVLASMVVTQAKFGQPVGIPLDKQANVPIDPVRRAALEANDGKLFAPRFMPTTVLAATRPDAVGGFRAFPFVGPPRQRPTVVGDVVFNDLEPALSMTTSMPLFVVLTLVALVVLIRRRDQWALFGVLVASAGGFVTTVGLAYTSTRYLADILPFLFLGAAIGTQALLARRHRHGRLLAAAFVALGAAGFVVNAGAGVVTQRLLNPETPASDRAAFIEDEDDIDDALGRRPHGVASGPTLPARVAEPGNLFVLDGCAGLYVAGYGRWLPVERTGRSGLNRLSVVFPARSGGRPEALLTIGRGPGRTTVVSRAAGGHVRMEVLSGGRRTTGPGPSVAVAPGRPAVVVVSFDPLTSVYFASVQVDGENAASGPAPFVAGAPLTLGRDPASPRLAPFSGRVRALPSQTSVCRTLVRRGALEPS
jgi:hypothetical protein